jgi:hypothetical protein
MKFVLKILIIFEMTVFICDGVTICERDDATCGQSSFSYPDGLTWDESSADELWSWLRVQLRKDLKTFCSDDVSTNDISNVVEKSVSIVAKTTSCDKTTATTFQGSVDRNGFPKGSGFLRRMTDNEARMKAGSKK